MLAQQATGADMEALQRPFQHLMLCIRRDREPELGSRPLNSRGRRGFDGKDVQLIVMRSGLGPLPLEGDRRITSR